VKRNETVKVLSPSGKNFDRKVVKIMGYKGLEKEELETAYSQQIVALYGIEGIDVGDTISSVDEPGVLEGIKIDEPTVSMEFYVNDGPFAQRDGKLVNITQIRDRLLREAQTNVGLKVEEIEGQSGFKVSGRGELHLAILIETMRREGYEFCVSKMKIITHIENGVEVEPQEYLILEAPQYFQGAIMSDMA
jgi:GTP-binding protein